MFNVCTMCAKNQTNVKDKQECSEEPVDHLLQKDHSWQTERQQWIDPYDPLEHMNFGSWHSGSGYSIMT